jgi:hypothetical protein
VIYWLQFVLFTLSVFGLVCTVHVVWAKQVPSINTQSCLCFTGLLLQPVMAAQYTQLSVDTFEADANHRLADLDISRGLAVTVRLETLAFEVRNAFGVVVASPDLFEGTTELFVQEDWVFDKIHGSSNEVKLRERSSMRVPNDWG